MITTNRIVAITLITALIGASLGAAAMYSRNTAATESSSATIPATSPPWNTGADAKYTDASARSVPAEFTMVEQQNAYKVGFADGFRAATDGNRFRVAPAQLSNSRMSSRTGSSSQRPSYNHSRSQGRSFWSKHRDKLTMAMGTGGGALVGGLIGGKKGAAIGSLAGLGGSALYTYKIRKRNRH